jgi:hypothetical protein
MASIEMRDLHLVKKALSIAVLALGRQSGPLQSQDDLLDMKLLLERLTSGAELEHYLRVARIVVLGDQSEDND